jgi:hypothetical protein
MQLDPTREWKHLVGEHTLHGECIGSILSTA